MTVSISNVALTNTFDFQRGQINLLAATMSNNAVTTQSNAAVGNAVITGTFQSVTLFANAIGGVGVVNSNGTVNTATTLLTITSNTLVNAVLQTNTSLVVGNSTVNAVVNSSTVQSTTVNTGTIIATTANVATLNVTTLNATGIISSPANVSSNGTLIGQALRLANTSQSVTVAIPTVAQTNGSYFLCGNGSWSAISIPNGVTPGGGNTQVQFNDVGGFGGSAGFLFDKSTNNMTVANTIISPLASFATANIVFVANGNAGWNTATPGFDIDIAGATNSIFVGARVLNTNTGTGSVAAIQVQSGTANAALSANSSTGAVGSSSGLHFGFTSNGILQALIAANGNFGIGTSTPGSKLDVSGFVNVLNDLTANNITGTTTLNTNTLNANTISGNAVSTTSQYLNATANKLITTSAAWAAAGAFGVTPSSSITLDFSLGINFSWTQNQNFTLQNPTNMKQGQSGFIFIVQDSTGSRTISYGSFWKFPNGAARTLTTTGSTVDCIFYTVFDPSPTTGFVMCSLNRAYS